MYGDGDSEDNMKGGAYVDTIEYATIDLLFASDVDEFWILGEETNPPFDKLTVQERQLLKWRFIDNKRSSEIAVKITEHPNTVREHLSKIKRKIHELLNEDGMEEYLFLTTLKKEKEKDE
jgi:hypothetical protein